MAVANRTPRNQDLRWYQSLLSAITAVQQQLQVGSRHSESINCILAESLELTGSQAGMLANVTAGEPCRLTDVVPVAATRDYTLAAFDEVARTALQRKEHVIANDADDNNIVALPLSIGSVVHGVLVLSMTMPWQDDLVESLAPFTGTAAAVLRQFQEDLSAPQVDAVLDRLADGILTVNNDGDLESINPAAEQMFGYSLDEVVGKSVRMLLSEPCASQHDQNLEHYRRNGELRIMGFGRELDGRRKDGTIFPMDVSVSQIEIEGRKVFAVIARDITEHKAHQQMVERERANTQTLEMLVRIDALTGIANRRHFDEALTNEVRRAARDQKPLSIILCDIDFFKAFNDRYGHPAGDTALRAVAKAIESCFQRAGEVAARYGGEEFGVVVPGADLDAAAGLAATMHDRIGELSIPHSASRISDHLTVSIGVASAVPGPHFDQNQLLEEADRALYRAKGSGRNRIRLAGSRAQAQRLHTR